MEVSRSYVSDSAVFRIRTKANGNFVTASWSNAKASPIILCQRQGETSLRCDDVPPVRCCVYLITPTLSIVDNLNTCIVRSNVIGYVTAKRSVVFLLDKRTLLNLAYYTAKVRETRIFYRHLRPNLGYLRILWKPLPLKPHLPVAASRRMSSTPHFLRSARAMSNNLQRSE